MQQRNNHVQMRKYFRVLLDQFLTSDIIGSCALAKILDVMIDSEMSFPEGEIPRWQSLVTRAYIKESTYS